MTMKAPRLRENVIVSLFVCLLAVTNFKRGVCTAHSPGDFVQSFEISSKIDNKTLTFSQRNIKSNNGSNFIFLNINVSDYFVMNFFNSNKSVDEFLYNANSGNIVFKTTFIFYSKDIEVLLQIRNKILARYKTLSVEDSRSRQLNLIDVKNSLFFADSGIPDYFTDFLNTNGWSSKKRYIESNVYGKNYDNSSFVVPRLDGEYEWSVWPCSDSATATTCATGVLIDSENL